MGVIFRLVLFVAFVGAVVYVAPQFMQTPMLLARPSAAPTTPAGPSSGIAGVEAALKQATQTGKSIPVTLRVTDGDLTEVAQRYFPQTYAGVTVADPAVRIGPALTLSATANSRVLSGPLVASATPYAIDGRLALRLDSASVGGVELPDPVRTQLQELMQSALNTAVPARLQVSSLAIATGSATISGNALP